MTEAAKRFLRSFEALSQADQREVLVNLLRLPIQADYAPPSDEELVSAADAVFEELDQAESRQ